jgi:hypothetical protein
VDYMFSTSSNVSWARAENLRRWSDEHPHLRPRLEKTISGINDFYEHYAYRPHEAFANLFALCLIEPRKAKSLAPNATDWLMKSLWKYPKIRAALTEAEIWELGTTQPSTALVKD